MTAASSAAAERDLMRLARARSSVSQLFYPSLESEVVTEYMLHRRKHHTDAAWTHLILGMHSSRTLYVGNLSFQTREEQLFELFSRAGHVHRIIMGLNAQTRTPCGFAFVEFDSHADARRAQSWFTGHKLDERVIRADLDQEFEEGRQYGRSKSGGQLSDDFRGDFDAARGGWGVAQQARKERKEQADRHRKLQLDQFRFSSGGDDAQPDADDEEFDPTETVDRVRTDARASRPLKLSASTIAALTEGVFPHYALPIDARVQQALQLAQGGSAAAASSSAAAASAAASSGASQQAAQQAAPAASSTKRIASPAAANGYAAPSPSAAAHVSSPPSKRPRAVHSPPRSPVPFAGGAAAAAASSSSPRPFSSGSPVAAHAGPRSPQAHAGGDGGARSPALLGAAGDGGSWTPPERGYTPEHDDHDDYEDHRNNRDQGGDEDQHQLSDGDRTPPPTRSPRSPPRRHDDEDLGHDDATPPPATDEPAGASAGVAGARSTVGAEHEDSELDDDAHTPRGHDHEDDRATHGRGRELDDDAATPPPLDADEADDGDAAMHDDKHQPDYAAFER